MKDVQKFVFLPIEYGAGMEQALPTSSGDIETMTEAFIVARYGRPEVKLDDADKVKAAWEKIRRALQNKANRNKSKSG